MTDQLQDQDDIREIVRERYAAAARAAAAAPEQSGCGCGPATGSSCCGSDAPEPRRALAVFGSALYDDAEAGQAPEAALSASLGCGVPTAVADLHEGETVLDLGSGAGADVLISARRVGPDRQGHRSRHDRRDARRSPARTPRRPASRTSSS